MRNRLIVMARQPRWGTGKRRLAAGAGELVAWRFQRVQLARLLRRLAGDPRWETCVALTPDRGRLPFGLPPVRIVPQGQGDLGRRMGRALAQAPAGPAIVIGADIPGIGADEIARAFRLLGAHDWVFGPAPDGGYWLAGTRRRPSLRLPFAAVRWSSPHTLADTVRGLAGQSVAFCATLADVDEAADLQREGSRGRIGGASAGSASAGGASAGISSARVSSAGGAARRITPSA